MTDPRADDFDRVLGQSRGRTETGARDRDQGTAPDANRDAMTLTDWALAAGADEHPGGFIAGVTTRVTVTLLDPDANHVEERDFGSAAAEVQKMRAFVADYVCAMAAEGLDGTVRFTVAP